jgi:2-phospho-L-lactate guanylyltransferase
VAEFDFETGSGRVLLDNGTPVSFPGAAFVASGLRFLRPGQRVRLEISSDNTVVLVTLVTM